ncbi:hypothetical protein CEXT_387861 [Caerostris extrusa]|uniref:Uncharacterized protein n=1 Tax=Caerostris extrusa TaxID=172846 RepID=A0AAV4XFD9_CAEEX|nr:hypothetical protein CEXT_387861 [Caerostris extrusa]
MSSAKKDKNCVSQREDCCLGNILRNTYLAGDVSCAVSSLFYSPAQDSSELLLASYRFRWRCLNKGFGKIVLRDTYIKIMGKLD